jgi:hypothetical protein
MGMYGEKHGDAITEYDPIPPSFRIYESEQSTWCLHEEQMILIGTCGSYGRPCSSIYSVSLDIFQTLHRYFSLRLASSSG